MSEDNTNAQTVKCVCECAGAERLQREFQHLKSDWLWLLLYGVLLAVCGTVGIVVPVFAAIGTMIVLGIALVVAGVATITLSFWAGKWTGLLVQVLVGVLYLVAGFAIFDTPVTGAMVMMLFIAAFFIVAGAFRILAAMLIRFPHWGWALLNGMVTFLLGVIIYRHFPHGAVWVLGLLIGLELLFNGWTWIMLALAIRSIPDKAAA
jgi:uncharacterized membrane protein HdeD (DUF308 family)